MGPFQEVLGNFQAIRGPLSGNFQAIFGRFQAIFGNVGALQAKKKKINKKRLRIAHLINRYENGLTGSKKNSKRAQKILGPSHVAQKFLIGTFLKVFDRRKLAQCFLFLTARLCRGSHTNQIPISAFPP